MLLEVIQANGGRLGGALHCHMRDVADAWYKRQGCTTESERSCVIDGQQRFVDLSVTWPDGRTEAVEIETDDSDRATGNVRKALIAGYDAITVLTPNRKIREAIAARIARQLGADDATRVKLRPMALYDLQRKG